MILRLLCLWLVFYSLLSSLILSNLKHELLKRLRSTMAANVLSMCYELSVFSFYRSATNAGSLQFLILIYAFTLFEMHIRTHHI
jgi:hypothetical protein